MAVSLPVTYLMGVHNGNKPCEQATEQGHQHRLHHEVLGQRPVLHLHGSRTTGHGAAILWDRRTYMKNQGRTPFPPHTPPRPQESSHLCPAHTAEPRAGHGDVLSAGEL